MADIQEIALSSSVATGVLQLASGVALDTALRAVTDQAGTASPLRLSTTQVAVNTNLLVGDSTGANAFITTEGNAGVFNSLYRYSNNATRARYEMYKSRGTKTTPLVVNTGDELGSIDMYGYDGTAFQRNVILLATANNVTGATITPRFSIGLGTSAGANDYIASWTSIGMVLGTSASSITPSARLHIRGDGTNPIARFESGAGVNQFEITNSGFATFAGNVQINNPNYLAVNNFQSTNFAAPITYIGYSSITLNPNASISTTGTVSHFIQTSLFAAAAGSANFRPINIAYTINNSGAQTGTATGIFLNATEPALNGMTHNLIDLQRGGVSQFRVDRVGAFSCGNTVTTATAVASTHKVTVVIGGVTYFLLASNV